MFNRGEKSAGRDRGKEDEEFFRQRGFGIKIGFGERPALVIIDMVKAFTDENAAGRQSRS